MAMPRALSTREARLHPFDWYRRKRARSPVHYDERRNCWDLFKYDLAKEVLRDHETFSSETRVDDTDTNPVFNRSMLSSDPPRHTRLRESLEEFFKPGSIADLEPMIRNVSVELLEGTLRDGSDSKDANRMDMVTDFAFPLPVTVIAEVLGVPVDDHELFHKASRIIAVPQGDEGENSFGERQTEIGAEMVEYLSSLIEKRRENPQDDLISSLVTESDLSHGELIDTSFLLMLAGHETTVNTITNTVWCLNSTDNLDAVMSGSENLQKVIEEVLRYRSPVQRTARRATTDTSLAGHDIEKGELVVVWLGAANRDPEQFDEPDEFVPDREPNQHIAFGHGIHFCLGAPLARKEAIISLSTLFDKLETIEAVDTDYEPHTTPFLNGVQSYPVRVEPAQSAVSDTSD